jgi:hypothetical protein
MLKQLDIFIDFVEDQQQVFTSPSPINTESVTGKNKQVFDLLNKYTTIDKYLARSNGIDELRSRISDLKNVHGIQIYSQLVSTENNLRYSIYSLKPIEK